jgi:hypothetical protein
MHLALAKARHLLSSGFTDLLVPVRQRSFKQSQSFCVVHPDPVRIFGSFFFSKGRNQGQFLFSTIAYQLALKVPGLRQHVNRMEFKLDPTLHTKSMDSYKPLLSTRSNI